MNSYTDGILLSGTLAQTQNHTCIGGSQRCLCAERALSCCDRHNEDIHIRFEWTRVSDWRFWQPAKHSLWVKALQGCRVKDTTEMNILPDMCALNKLFEPAYSVKYISEEHSMQLFISLSEDFYGFNMIIRGSEEELMCCLRLI